LRKSCRRNKIRRGREGKGRENRKRKTKRCRRKTEIYEEKREFEAKNKRTTTSPEYP
jgi:hypothetical protein